MRASDARSFILMLAFRTRSVGLEETSNVRSVTRMLKEFRCSNCNKLLGKIEGKAEIVCTRCKTMNKYEGETPDVLVPRNHSSSNSS
ncbi:Com family DNA-binding transcriptional regulator [Paenibacillus sp. FSL H8-0548]|uniref:Com family DNA-binding transcriptional regulator n=1 Tax=Paenibacillus sp. FSL H8-0548 TaxID=1920422 RepID=UPI0009FA88ED